MELEEAKTLLSTAVKSELRDHAFGDCEVVWTVGYAENGTVGHTNIAHGYFGSGESYVRVGDTRFEGDEAFWLRQFCASQKVERNDETGPDDFEIGRVMPGLTLEGVRKELTGE
jgi:hypothetical protein